MHVSATGLRVVRRGGALRLRSAPLGDVAFAMVELPDEGSRGTSLEQRCLEAHWGVVLRGSLEIVRGDQRQTLQTGSAFHIPGGEPAHQLFAAGPMTMAGFIPLGRDPVGAEQPAGGSVGSASAGVATTSDDGMLPPVIRDLDPAEVPDGRVEAEAAEMGPWMLCRARFGRSSGYVTSWCDAEHYGIVVEGDLALEWEDDVEVLSAGDVYHCPQGPPGHRFEVADWATVVDLTPLAALRNRRRLAEWRQRAIAVVSGNR